MAVTFARRSARSLASRLHWPRKNVRRPTQAWRWQHANPPNRAKSQPWTQQVADSTQRRTMRKTLEKVAAVSRELAKKTTQYVTNQGRATLQSSKEFAEARIKALRNKVSTHATKLSEQAMTKAQEWTRQASQSAQKAGAHALRTSQQLARNTYDQAVLSGKEMVRQSANYAASSVQQVTKQAQASIHRNTAFWTSVLQNNLRSALWWGLAFVGVYGVATTLPVEVFRYLTKQNKKTAAVDDDSDEM